MKINYIRSGYYFIPYLKLSEETRPIGKWGRMHRDYLKEYRPIQFNNLILSGNLWTYLADLNEQAQQRMETLIGRLEILLPKDTFGSHDFHISEEIDNDIFVTLNGIRSKHHFCTFHISVLIDCIQNDIGQHTHHSAVMPETFGIADNQKTNRPGFYRNS